MLTYYYLKFTLYLDCPRFYLLLFLCPGFHQDPTCLQLPCFLRLSLVCNSCQYLHLGTQSILNEFLCKGTYTKLCEVIFVSLIRLTLCMEYHLFFQYVGGKECPFSIQLPCASLLNISWLNLWGVISGL